jgi:signal peptidase I
VRLRRAVRIRSLAVGLVVVASLLLSANPERLGGYVRYAYIWGNSMEPSLHMRDVAIVRAQDRYEVGDAVAYRNPDLGLVLHRIIARDGDRFILQGDNNSFTDAYRPNTAEIAGKLWLTIPSGGRAADFLRSPTGTALLAGLMFASIAMPFAKRRLRRDGPRAGPPRWQPLPAERWRQLAICGCIAVLAAGAAGSFALSRLEPLERATVQTQYEHAGTFAYDGAAPASIYGRDRLQPGDPAFFRQVDALRVTFTYRLSGIDGTLDDAGVRGTQRLRAEVSQVNGWQRDIPLTPQSAFTGGTFAATAPVDLGLLRQIVAETEAATGTRYESYSVRVIADVALEGTLAGTEIRDQFAPALAFRLDLSQLQVDRRTEAGQSKDPFHTTSKRSAAREVTRPARLEAWRVEVPLALAQRAAIASMAAAGMAALAVLLYPSFARRKSEAARIASTYGYLLVDAVVEERGLQTPVVAIPRFRDLAALAEASSRRVLHVQGPRAGEHRYYVLEQEAAYCFTTRDVAGAMGSANAVPV